MIKIIYQVEFLISQLKYFFRIKTIFFNGKKKVKKYSHSFQIDINLNNSLKTESKPEQITTID